MNGLHFTPELLVGNIVWPGLYLLEGYKTFIVIIVGLALETGCLMGFAQVKAHKAFPITILANACSALLGWFVFPDLSYQMALIPRETFGIAGWMLALAAAWLFTMLLEVPAVWSLLRKKRTIRQVLLACSVGNLVSVLLAVCFARYPGGSG